MPNEEPPIEPAAGASAPEHATTAERSVAMHETAVQAPALAYEPDGEDGGWLDEPEELPRRPRRRLLAPIPIALLIVLLTACGFIGGVLVEKGQGSSGSSSGTGASALASRFAALRGGGAGAKSGASGSGATAAGGLFGGSGGSSGAAGTGAGATTGQVAYVQGSTLYVTTAEGNTVKVDTSPASTVTKTVKADVSSIHPGETVLVTGAAGTNGAVSAESIRVGAGGGGALAGLFGRSGGGSSAGGSAGSSSGGGGEPALFGKGG
jgi:hypothetical protein